MAELVIRPMRREELDGTIDAAAREGWNPGLHDADCFWAIDPDGFFVGTIEGQLVGRVAAVRYDDRYAFVGLYIVEPEFRGRGHGLAITQEWVRHVGERNAGLDGVEAMIDRYARLGYRPAHRSVRHTFTPRTRTEPDRAIVGADQLAFADLLAYDTRHMPTSRARFLEPWITRPGTVALAYVDGAVIGGFGVMRPCRQGWRVGPLFAEEPRIAESLLLALCNHAIGDPVSLDIPEPNREARAMAARLGMEPAFVCVRMYLRGDPGLPLDRIFGITALEVG